MNFKNPEGQVARWLERLSSYDMKIEHRAGRLHSNADGLSRQVCKQFGLDCKGKQKAKCATVSRIEELSQITARDVENLDLISAQEEDDDVATVQRWVSEGARPDSKYIQDRRFYLKYLWTQWDMLSIQDDLLVQELDIIRTSQILWQTIIEFPLKQRRVVLNYSHDIKASGHLGIKKTPGRIRKRFYWPGKHKDVQIYVYGCEICAKRKSPRRIKWAPDANSKEWLPARENSC